MALTANDLKVYLSGGYSNTDGFASLGGPISATEMPTGQWNQIWPNLLRSDKNPYYNNPPGVKASGNVANTTTAGFIYRCFYVKNESATDTAYDVAIGLRGWGMAHVPFSLAKGAAGISAEETAIENEMTAPGSVTWPAWIAPYQFAHLYSSWPENAFRGTQNRWYAYKPIVVAASLAPGEYKSFWACQKLWTSGDYYSSSPLTYSYDVKSNYTPNTYGWPWHLRVCALPAVVYVPVYRYARFVWNVNCDTVYERSFYWHIHTPGGVSDTLDLRWNVTGV